MTIVTFQRAGNILWCLGFSMYCKMQNTNLVGPLQNFFKIFRKPMQGYLKLIIQHDKSGMAQNVGSSIKPSQLKQGVSYGFSKINKQSSDSECWHHLCTTATAEPNQQKVQHTPHYQSYLYVHECYFDSEHGHHQAMLHVRLTELSM